MIAIVVQAIHRVGKRALTHRVLVGLAVAAFLALTVFGVPFPLVVLAAGLLGWIARPAGSPPLAVAPVTERPTARSR